MEEFRDDQFSEEEIEQEEVCEQYNAFDEEVERQEELSQKQDEFLDVYGAYLDDKNVFMKKMLDRKKIELEVLDPDFQIDIE